MKKLINAITTMCDHYEGLSLSENPTSDTYTPVKGYLENQIRGSVIAYNTAVNLISDIKIRVKKLERNWTGSEIEDVNLQRNVVALEKLADQLVAHEQVIDACKSIYKERIGVDYTPRVKSNPDSAKVTESMSELSAIMTKLSNVKQLVA